VDEAHSTLHDVLSRIGPGWAGASRDPGAAMPRRRLFAMNTDLCRAGEGRSIWVAGDLYTIKAAGEDTSGAFALIEVRTFPGGGTPPHLHHREDEAFYVLEGEYEFHADGRSFTAGPGDWVTLARGSLHYFKNPGPASARMLVVATPAGLEKFFLEACREATDRSPEAGIPTPEEIERLLALAPKYGIKIQPPSP
jgi:quercetin dioxygenase-like cupin family protein